MVEIRTSWSPTVESLIAPLAVQLKRNGGTVEEQRRNCVNNCVWVGGMICAQGKVWSRSRPRSQEENRAYSTLLSRFKRLLVLLKDASFYNHRCNVKWFKQLIHGLQFCWKSPIFACSPYSSTDIITFTSTTLTQDFLVLTFYLFGRMHKNEREKWRMFHRQLICCSCFFTTVEVCPTLESVVVFTSAERPRRTEHHVSLQELSCLAQRTPHWCQEISQNQNSERSDNSLQFF